MDPLAGNLDRQVLDGPGYLLCSAEQCVTGQMATVFSCRCCLRLVIAHEVRTVGQLKGGRSKKISKTLLKGVNRTELGNLFRPYLSGLQATQLLINKITSQDAALDKAPGRQERAVNCNHKIPGARPGCCSSTLSVTCTILKLDG